jgi:hypothetical protein
VARLHRFVASEPMVGWKGVHPQSVGLENRLYTNSLVCTLCYVVNYINMLCLYKPLLCLTEFVRICVLV